MTKRMTDEEIIRYYEDLKAQGKLYDNLVPVKARVSKNLGIVFSVRFTPEDLDAIEDAAKARGMTISDFIRKAAMGAVAGGEQLAAGEKATALEEVRERVRELSEAVSRL